MCRRDPQFFELAQRSFHPGWAATTEAGGRCCTSPSAWRPSMGPIRDRCALIGVSKCRSSPALLSASSPGIRGVRQPARHSPGPLACPAEFLHRSPTTQRQPLSTTFFQALPIAWYAARITFPRVLPSFAQCLPSVLLLLTPGSLMPSVHRRVCHAPPGADTRDLLRCYRRPSLCLEPTVFASERIESIATCIG